MTDRRSAANKKRQREAHQTALDLVKDNPEMKRRERERRIKNRQFVRGDPNRIQPEHWTLTFLTREELK